MQFRMLGLFAWIHVVLGMCGVGVAVVLFLKVVYCEAFDPAQVHADTLGQFLVTGYGLATIAGIFVVALSLAAYGQFILLVMKIEENTRPA